MHFFIFKMQIQRKRESRMNEGPTIFFMQYKKWLYSGITDEEERLGKSINVRIFLVKYMKLIIRINSDDSFS